ncbi:nitroreductase family protein [Desertivirga xinjiangensis]|uniref:nitroreductase family protein n=1 Tax=Desertivirga xinjiangensis TaxID=539206 RepID=UPI00210B1AEE|nr:nitroreductase family protein [Pedobacter xinjiangensis]
MDLTKFDKIDENRKESVPFNKLIRLRKSCRGFLPTSVPAEIITSVLEDAQQAPSNCNTQPWSTHVVSGEKLKELSAALLQELEAGNFTPDFTFDNNHFYGTYSDRQKAQGKAYDEGMGVARGDKQSRKAVEALNWKFYNAPQAAFLFMPSFGDHVRVASDIGMLHKLFFYPLRITG